MSRQVNTVMFNQGDVRHLASKVPTTIRHLHYKTLCGIDTFRHTYRLVDDDRKAQGRYRHCKTCVRVRRLHDLDLVTPDADAATTRRGEAITARGDGAVRPIDAAVFRVTGSTDTYTVTVPVMSGLATLCNCMSGKTRPHIECKHQAAVRLWINETGEETNG